LILKNNNNKVIADKMILDAYTGVYLKSLNN
jgi:hypothetical protein